MSRPLLYDLFSGAGGAAAGYERAGFHVVGVDHEPQPRYAGSEFVQADVFEFMRAYERGEYPAASCIHASPPCQFASRARVIHGHEHADLLTPTREVLNSTGVPWVIENVPGAPMRPDLVLCGSMFPELRDGEYGIIRHRWFEFSQPLAFLVPPCAHPSRVVSVFGHGGHVYHGVEQWRRVMGISWMSRDELSQAIPPAYTHFIGEQLYDMLVNEREREAG